MSLSFVMTHLLHTHPYYIARTNVCIMYQTHDHCNGLVHHPLICKTSVNSTSLTLLGPEVVCGRVIGLFGETIGNL